MAPHFAKWFPPLSGGQGQDQEDNGSVYEVSAAAPGPLRLLSLFVARHRPTVTPSPLPACLRGTIRARPAKEASMRRALPLFAVLCLAFAPAPLPKDWGQIDRKTLQGEWVLVGETHATGPPRAKRSV